MTDKQAEIIATAIRDGFADLGDRIAGGKSPENVAMSLMELANNLSGLVSELSAIAEAINNNSREAICD